MKKVYDFPNTMDMIRFDGIEISYANKNQEETWIKITFYPLASGRPEFIEKTEAEILLPVNREKIFVPFTIFDHSHLVYAHMKYISHMEIMTYSEKESVSYQVEITDICFKKSGDFHVEVEVNSRVGKEGEQISWEVVLENERDITRYVTVHEEYAGRECLELCFPRKIILAPMERKTIKIQTQIPERMPCGGYEKRMLHMIPDGDGERERIVDLYAAKAQSHPWMIHKEDGWKHLSKVLQSEGELREKFLSEYEKRAQSWQVPEPCKSKQYVYISESQHDFLATAITWKITGEAAYLEKILKYLKGFMDKEDGYLTTQYSYFQFIESVEEYKKGTFPVHRACSAGWVQEAEFMTKIAMVYDLVYDREEFTDKMHKQMEQCMRNYMAFEDWRLTDGDGNNFQIAEASASLYCACLLQDYPMINRFLAGTNGLYELMGSVFSDDGSYFEGASGYMRLAAELYLQIANAMENIGINLKDVVVPASFDKAVIHAPWAMKKYNSADKKPFLGMGFDRACKVEKPTRRLKEYLDNILKMLNKEGILFSANDSNEQSFVQVMEMAYYLYKDPDYLKIAKINGHKDVLYGSHMLEEASFEPGKESFLNQGNGYAILREKKENQTQVVLKYGQHGGYHGHFDRLSLLSYMKDNKTFHNQEFTWYGYNSFLFKMWVQASLAHNMVVVDGRMQEPTECECIYYEDNEKFHAVCAQTVSRWSDPPYGGQTPYPMKFPDEKCQKEKRYILKSDEERRQGEIGEYSEPVFQRRLIILAEGCIYVWDYEESEHEHVFDCLYHPFGSATIENLYQTGWKERMDENSYGAGQFIMDCHWYEQKGTAKLKVQNTCKRKDSRDLIEFVSNVSLYGVYPQLGDVMIARYPQISDTFENVEDYITSDFLEQNAKKVLSFRQRGKCARFVTAMEIGENKDKIKEIISVDYENIVIHMQDGSIRQLEVKGMDRKEGQEIEIKYT